MSIIDALTFDADDHNDHDEEASAASSKPPVQAATTLLVSAALDAALTAKGLKMLTGTTGTTVIIELPSALYISPACKALKSINAKANLLAIKERKRKGTSDEVDLSRHIASDCPLVALTPDVTLLQPAVQAVADLTVKVHPPTAAMVRRVINTVTGGRARKLLDADLAGRGLDQIAAAIRPGSSARDCVRRLKRPTTTAAESSFQGPNLATLPLFGEAKAWAGETIDDIARMQRGEIVSGDIENTLLYGPPGTGKTVLAGALAKAAGLPFYDSSVAAWFTSSDGNLDGVLKAAEQFFDTLLASAPCVGFLDEFEALPDRAVLEARHREWWNSIITGVLLMITKLRHSGKPIILIGATNYINRIDGALKRPGRMGRHVLVRPAETEAEIAMLIRFYLPDELDEPAIALAASLVLAATPAQVEGWVKAARRMAREAMRPLVLDDLVAQIAPPDLRSETLRYAVAVHEAGHAVVALALGFDLERVSIIADGATGGLTTWRNKPESRTLGDIENQVSLLLAGRAADQMLGRGADAGARIDLEMATTALLVADASLGLRDSLLFRAEEHAVLSLLRSDQALATRIGRALDTLMERVLALVELHRDAILAVAAKLVQQRLLTGTEVKTIMSSIVPHRQAGIRRPVAASRDCRAVPFDSDVAKLADDHAPAGGLEE